MDFLAVLFFVFVGALPFAPLLAKPLRRHSNAGVRRCGDVVAMLALWLTFDVSVAAIWGAVIRGRIEEGDIPVALAVLGMAQIPAAWISARVVFGGSGSAP